MIPVEEEMGQGQKMEGQASSNIRSNPSLMSQAAPRIHESLSGTLPINPNNSNYWHTLVSELMK